MRWCLADKMAEMPDSVNQQAHAALKEECSAKPAHGSKPVAIRLFCSSLTVEQECRRVADRDNAGADGNICGCNSGGSCYRGPEFRDRLSTHDENSNWRGCRGMHSTLQDQPLGG